MENNKADPKARLLHFIFTLIISANIFQILVAGDLVVVHAARHYWAFLFWLVNDDCLGGEEQCGD
jgi:hypothetical protein